MPKKMMLTSRLEPELIARINAASAANRTTVANTISFAVDALEREQKTSETVTERVEKLETNIANLVDTMKGFCELIKQQFTEASFNEKERLQNHLRLLAKKIDEHDKNDEERLKAGIKFLLESPNDTSENRTENIKF